MQNSLDEGKHRDLSSLTKTITTPKVVINKNSPTTANNPRDWGLKHEDSARQSYYKVESKKHCNLSLVSKGLLVSKIKPFLAASVDNIRRCGCAENCEEVVVEFKCPWKHCDKPAKEAFLTTEIGGEKVDKELSLKASSRYYAQIQLQMFVTELKSCDFVVWTLKGIITVNIPYNPHFMENAIKKLERFWLNNILPVMADPLATNQQTPGKSLLFKTVLCIFIQVFICISFLYRNF